MNSIGLLALIALAYAVSRSRSRPAPAAIQHLGRWKLVFVVMAAIVAVLVILNPGSLAFGLLGDAAFLDLFVLALTLQLHMVATGTWQHIEGAISRGVRWLMMPSTAMGCMVTLFVFAVGAMVNTIHRR